MRGERAERIERLFAAAAELEGDVRRSFLAGACKGDEALRREVESLLAAEEEAAHFLEVPEAASFREAAPRPPAPGDRLGAYRLVEELGSGGSSVVFLGRRDDGAFEKQVAVKVLRQRRLTGDWSRRFAKERQILAGLEHPNVARLFDAGTAPDGAPYFVLELVEGEPLDRYCDRRHLSLPARLEIFRKVCSAVHYAHQNLVIHRDLKPANVLVTAAGEPKLLDFGIAELTGFGRSASPDGFAGERRWLTPLYASPEQLRGLAVTTATDVFSLGVILFELITGDLPWGRAVADPEAVLLALEEEAVPSPGEALRRASSTETGRSARDRGTTPARLRRAAAGDLAAITARALRFDPQERYASAEVMGQDVERHLQGLPVTASERGVAYRFGKRIRRHKGVAAAVVAAGLLLLAAVVGLSVASERLAEKNRLLVEERNRDVVVQSFLTELFAGAPLEPELSPGLEEDLLGRVLATGRRLLPQAPGPRAEAIAALGSIALASGEPERAEGLLEEALDLRRREFGPDHLQTADSLQRLGALRALGGRSEEGAQMLEEALRIRLQHRERSSVAVASNLNDLGMALTEVRGRLEEARAHLEESLSSSIGELGMEDPRVASIYVNLSSNAYAAGDWERGEKLARRALDVYRASLGESHPWTASARITLAASLAGLGKLEEADGQLRRALDSQLEVYGEDHWRLPFTLDALGEVARQRGQVEQALVMARRALEIRRRILPARHRDLVLSVNNLGVLLLQQGELETAAPLLAEALALRRELFGDVHGETAQSLHNLGGCRREQGRLAEAEALVAEAVAIRRSELGPEHPALAYSLTLLGEIRLRRGRPLEAEAPLRAAVEILEGQLEPGSRRILRARAALRQSLESQARTGPWKALGIVEEPGPEEPMAGEE